MVVYRNCGWVLLLVVMAVTNGCGSSSSSGGNSGGTSMDALAGAVDAQNAARKQEAAAAAKAAEEQKAAAAQAAQTPAEQQKTVAGRAAMPAGGYYSAIVGARRHILNEAESWAWKQAVQHFKATEGRKPKDHDEFMKKVVAPLELNLGFKEENQEFLYDPSAESDGDLGVLYVVEKEPAQK